MTQPFLQANFINIKQNQKQILTYFTTTRNFHFCTVLLSLLNYKMESLVLTIHTSIYNFNRATRICSLRFLKLTNPCYNISDESDYSYQHMVKNIHVCHFIVLV